MVRPINPKSKPISAADRFAQGIERDYGADVTESFDMIPELDDAPLTAGEVAQLQSENILGDYDETSPLPTRVVEEDVSPEASRSIEERMQELEDDPTEGFNRIVEEIKDRGIADPDLEGTTSLTPIVERQLRKHLDLKRKEAPLPTKESGLLETRSAENLRVAITSARQKDDPSYKISFINKQSSEELIDLGARLKLGFSSRVKPLLQDRNNPTSTKLVNFLLTNKLIDEMGRPTNTLANAGAIAMVEALKDAVLKENKNIFWETNDFGVRERKEGKNLAGTTLQAEDIQTNLGRLAIDYAIPNVNATNTGMATKFGGSSANVDSEVVAALDVLLSDMMNDEGFFQNDVDINNPGAVSVTAEGATYYQGIKDILPALGIRDLTYRSKVPVRVPTLADVRGQKKKGDLSIAGKISRARTQELEVLNILNAMAVKIDHVGFTIATKMVNEVIKYNLTGVNKGIGVGLETPQAQIDDGQFRIDTQNTFNSDGYSDSIYAKTLGLDQASWKKALLKAQKTLSDIEARDQARMVMHIEARKIIKMMNRALSEMSVDQNGNAVSDIYYNEYFTSSSVGRYFMRNSDVNPQTSKLARMFVVNAYSPYINPEAVVTSPTDTYKGWAYIIGYNLLDTGRPSEEKGWNEIQNPTLQILKEGERNSTYNSWVAKGKLIQEAMVKDPNKIDREVLGEELFEEIFEATKGGNKGEWVYKVRSYIDMANFNEVRKSKAPNAIFQPTAQVEHDGKSNGIAIQALQLGNENILKHIGLLYADANNVVPYGTIREKFVEKMSMNIKGVFAGDPDKEAYWGDMYKNILEMEDRTKRSSIIKLLSKLPLMEVSYGKATGYNYDSATELLGEYGNDILSPDSENLYVNNESQRVEDLNILIQNTLESMLDIKTQKILKRFGEAFAIMGLVPDILGPLGTPHYLGGKTSIPILNKDGTPKTIKIPLRESSLQTGEILAENNIDVPIRQVINTATNPSKNTKLIKNPETDEWVSEPTTLYGKQVENQAPVVLIQQIDAAIMRATIAEINRDRVFPGGSRKARPPLFVIPIHDAIITDASSVSQYHSTINKKFKEIAMGGPQRGGYNMFTAVRDTYNRGLKRFENSLKDNFSKKNAINYDNERWRALHRFLVNNQLAVEETKEEKEERLEQLGYSDKGGGIQTSGKVPTLSPTNRAAINQYAKSKGWRTDGSGFLTNQEILAIVKQILSESNGFKIDALLSDRIKVSNANKELVRNTIAKQRSYQIN